MTGSFDVTYEEAKYSITTLPPNYLTIKVSYDLPINGGWTPSPFIGLTGEQPYVLPTSPTGEWVVGINPGFHILAASVCAHPTATIPFYVSANLNECCPECAGCFGGPISAATGNMRYTESDPLPTNDGMPFVRTYDSKTTNLGLLGRGWFSFLDESATSKVEVNGTTTIVITTAQDNIRAFNGNGTFTQLWPKQPNASSLRSDGAGGYVFREYSSDIEHYFSNGRITKLRQVSSGRETRMVYTSGFITGVVDSWGAWSWTVTEDHSRRVIESIAVDGTPIVWSYNYDASRNLLTAAEGGVPWRTYTYSGSLAEVRDANGHLIESHAYGLNGATSSLGREDDVTNVVYGLPTGDPNRTKIVVTYASGAQVAYYISSIALRPRVDQVDGDCPSCGNRNAVYAYDSEGRIVREQDARGYITARSFDALGRLVTETGALTPAGCDPETDSTRCRRAGSLGTIVLASTSASFTRTFTYGSGPWYDRPLSISMKSVLNGNGSRLETMTYDLQTGQMLTRAVSGWTGSPDSPELETQTTTTALYDGSVTALFAPGGAFDSSWLSLPQPAGLRKSIDGPRSDVADVTMFVYYPLDNSVPGPWRGRLAAVRNAAGHITRYEDYDVFGNARRVIDANGVATETTFDGLGRPLATTIKGVDGCDTIADPLCANDLTVSAAYSPATGSLASRSDANGNVTAYDYESRERVSSISRGPSNSDPRERMEYTYDASTGRKSMERYLQMDSGAWVEKRRELFTYDTLSQLIAQTHTDSTSIGYTYDAAGAVATVRDENHSAPNTRYIYDSAHRLSHVYQKLGADEIATSYAYDLAGNLTSVTDPNGNVTSYRYDDFGRMVLQTSPVTGTTTYSYDPGGNLISSTDANDATTDRSYDELGRVLAAVSSRGGLDDETVSYTYDQDYCGVGNGIGRLAFMDDPTGESGYCYDRRGLLAATSDSSGLMTMFSHDANGNRVSLVYPSGRTVFYTYDFANRPLTASADGVAIVTAASYLPFGPATQLGFGNGTTKTMAFDNRYRPAEYSLTGPSGTIADYIYAEDAAGNITQIHDGVDSTWNRDFGYDDLNRLITANTGTSLWGTGSYAYDLMGNMTSLQVGSRSLVFSYNGSTPQVQSVSGTAPESVTYDAAGNEELGTYGPRNLLQTIGGRFFSSRWIDYYYDGRGVRVGATWHQKDDLHHDYHRGYVYSPELHLLSQTGWQRFLVYGSFTEYVWFGDQPVAELPMDTEQPPSFTFTDHLGTPILQTGANAEIIWRAEYEPFGGVYAYRAGNASQVLGLPGQEVPDGFDSYNIFRWYRAGWGRYIQADPLYMNSETSLYAYVDGNPIRWKDRLGLDGDGPSWDYQDGPWHPDRPVSCSKADDCPTLKTKIGLISRTIASHRHWDAMNLAMGGTGDRHVDEIKDWVNAINKCKDIYEEKCRNTHDGCKPCKFVKEMGPVMLGGYIIYKAAEFFFCPPLVPLTP